MTVNPATGEVFYHTSKDATKQKGMLIHQLTPCSGGEFHPTGPPIAVTPKTGLAQRDGVRSLTPVRSLALARRPLRRRGGTTWIKGGDPTQSALGYQFASVAEVAPVVESELVAGVSATTAELRAQINPKGFDTTYTFQYITDAAYKEDGESFTGAAEAPLGGGAVGSGQAGLTVSQILSGLEPATEYHYRAIATSECGEPEKVCEGVGLAQTFRTFSLGTGGLPDGRAYEQVSPPEKRGGQVVPAEPGVTSCGLIECKQGIFWEHFPMQATSDGEAVVYEGSPFPPDEGAVMENEYLARRDPNTGWQTTTLSPLLQGSGENQGFKAFDSGLAKGVLYQLEPSLSAAAPNGYANLYTQPTSDPSSLSPVLEAQPPNRSPGFLGTNNFLLTYAGASADFSRIFFEANDALTGETPFAPSSLDGGKSKMNLYEWEGGQLRLVNVLPANATTVPGASFAPGNSQAISSDGSRVFWSSEAGQVYVRDDGETTREVPDSGEFATASADGSGLLMSDGKLFDVEDLAAPPTDLTQGKGGFQGILGQSDDLTQVYFVDTAVLDETPNEHGDVAQNGQNNVYAWDEGFTDFIATLSPKDDRSWDRFPSGRMAEASPDGRWVAFLSRAALIPGFDNIGPCEVSGGGEFQMIPCDEAYLYDSATGDLLCASCNSGNTQPLGRTVLRLIKGAKKSLPQPRYLTNSGRLYFDSQDSLAPSDTNDNVEDVYQFEPKGVGSCERDGGCVSLISAGREAADSNFLTMDASGNNVFFTSRDRLVAADRDELVDLYDARVNGGIRRSPHNRPGDRPSPSPARTIPRFPGTFGPENQPRKAARKAGSSETAIASRSTNTARRRQAPARRRTIGGEVRSESRNLSFLSCFRACWFCPPARQRGSRFRPRQNDGDGAEPRWRDRHPGRFPPYSYAVHFELKTDEAAKAEGGEMRDVIIDLPPGSSAIHRRPPAARAKASKVASQLLTVDPDRRPAGRLSRASAKPMAPSTTSPRPRGSLLSSASAPSGWWACSRLRCRSEEGYGVRVSHPTFPIEVTSVTATVWGAPADPGHTPERGPEGNEGVASHAPLLPFLTLPTSCLRASGVDGQGRLQAKSRRIHRRNRACP